jgi:biopolymer transport protein ExbB/TolQ
MTQDFSIVHLLLNASWVVQVVVLMLMGVSITSWAAIFRKIGSIKRVNELNDEFERDFWSVRGCGPKRQNLWPHGTHLRQRHARVPKTA